MKKAVLISQQGSGSNLLREFLNTHKDIYFGNELFCTKTDEGIEDYGTFKFSKLDKGNFLDNFFNNRHIEKKKEVIGFDIKYNQIDDDILDYIAKNDLYVMHLFRDNIRTFFRSINIGDRRTFSIGDILEYKSKIEGLSSGVRDKFGDKKYFEIFYEDMTRGREIDFLPTSVTTSILDFLGVDFEMLLLDKEVLNKKNLKIRY